MIPPFRDKPAAFVTNLQLLAGKLLGDAKLAETDRRPHSHCRHPYCRRWRAGYQSARPIFSCPVQINAAELFAYRLAVGRQTQEIIRGLRPDVLDEVIDGNLVQRARDEGAFGPTAEWVAPRWERKRKAFP
jgi:hypothetical protein